jgi:hypothetical protein
VGTHITPAILAAPNDVISIPPDVLHCEFNAVVAVMFISGPNIEHILSSALEWLISLLRDLGKLI